MGGPAHISEEGERMTRKGHNGPPRGVDVTAEYVAHAVARLERLDADKAAIN